MLNRSVSLESARHLTGEGAARDGKPRRATSQRLNGRAVPTRYSSSARVERRLQGIMMPTVQLDLQREPTGAAYTELLTLLARHCQTFSLVVIPSIVLRSAASGVLARLEPYLQTAEETTEWPGTQLLGHSARIYRYRLDPNSLAILLDAAPGLYAWRQPDLPEDLAVYDADGRVWLGSIAHERDAWIDVPAELVRSLGSVLRLKPHVRD